MRKTFKIFASLSEESKEGWIWMSPSDNVTSDFIKIKNLENRKSTICERRVFDPNYLKYYNSQTSTHVIEDPNSSLVINAHYRSKLGGLTTKETVELEIMDANCFIHKYLVAPWHHPNPFMRLGLMLGTLSVVLGAIGFILGLISIRCH